MNEALYEKTILCPICNREFVTKKVKTSAIRISKRDEDFCPYYEGENPLFYGVFVCVHCGYASLEGSFSNRKSEDIRKIIDIVTPRWHSRSYGEERKLDEAIEVYKLALLCCNILEEKSSVIGKICLRLSWFYRYKEDYEEEKKFIDFTIKSFEDAFTGERMDSDEYDEITILYLLGELNRRANDYNKSIMWFDKTLSHPHIKKKRHIELKARNQWSIARDQYKIQKKAAGCSQIV